MVSKRQLRKLAALSVPLMGAVELASAALGTLNFTIAPLKPNVPVFELGAFTSKLSHNSELSWWLGVEEFNAQEDRFQIVINNISVSGVNSPGFHNIEDFGSEAIDFYAGQAAHEAANNVTRVGMLGAAWSKHSFLASSLLPAKDMFMVSCYSGSGSLLDGYIRPYFHSMMLPPIPGANSFNGFLRLSKIFDWKRVIVIENPTATMETEFFIQLDDMGVRVMSRLLWNKDNVNETLASVKSSEANIVFVTTDYSSGYEDSIALRDALHLDEELSSEPYLWFISRFVSGGNYANNVMGMGLESEQSEEVLAVNAALETRYEDYFNVSLGGNSAVCFDAVTTLLKAINDTANTVGVENVTSSLVRAAMDSPAITFVGAAGKFEGSVRANLIHPLVRHYNSSAGSLWMLMEPKNVSLLWSSEYYPELDDESKPFNFSSKGLDRADLVRLGRLALDPDQTPEKDAEMAALRVSLNAPKDFWCPDGCVNGQCTGQRQCQCDPLWMGVDCATYMCSKSCGEYGTCTGLDQCACSPEDRWTGTWCDKKRFVDASADGVYMQTIVPAAIGLVLIVVVAGVIFVHREHPVVRASSVPFMGIVLVALSFGFISVLVQGGKPTSGSCVVQTILPSMALTFLLSPILIKNMLIRKIFTTTQVVKVSYKTEMAYMLSIVAIKAFLLLIWAAAFPPSPTTTQIFDASFLTCSMGSPALFYITVIYDVGLMIGMVYLALKIRNLPSLFNESRTMVYTVYNLLLMIIGFGVILVGSEGALDAIGRFRLAQAAMLAMTFSSFACLFGHKIYCIIYADETDAIVDEFKTRGNTSRTAAGNKKTNMNTSTE